MLGKPQRRVSIALLLGVAVLAAGSGSAAVLNVPGTSATIQAAINAAAAGDTILVANGTYTETVTINKRVTVISVNGAAHTLIRANVNDTPVVTISADGVVLGAAGQGFTIVQQDAGPAGAPQLGNCAVRVAGDQVKTLGVTIRDNALKGNASDEGILVKPNIEGGKLTIEGNAFNKDGAALFGFKDAIYFDGVLYAGELATNVSAHTATINLLNNYPSQFDRSGIYFEALVHRSTVNVTGGTYTGNANADYGLYFATDLANFSHLTLTNVTFDSVDYGFRVSSDVEHQSTCALTGGTIKNFRTYGVYLDVDDDSVFAMTGVTLNGATNADEGVDLDVYYSRATITGCTITGVDSYGVYYYVEAGTATVTNNTITMVDNGSSAYGIYSDTEYGADSVIRGNTVTGFDYCGIYENYPYAGSSVIIDQNTVTASTGGGNYGIWVDEIEYGCQATVTNNTVSNFDYAGAYIDYCYYGSLLTVTGNTFTALATTGADYGIYAYETSYQSDTFIRNNTCTNFTDYGLEVDYVYYDGTFTFTGNVLTAHPTLGAGYGIYGYDFYEGATATFDNNRVTGFGGTAGTDYGFYNDEVYDGATFVFTNNTFNAASGGAEYGFYSSSGFEYGATGTFSHNTFTGFIDEGAYIDYGGYEGCHLTMTHNTFTAAATGAEYGIDFGTTADYGSEVTVAFNTVSGFTDYGLYTGDPADDGSVFNLTDNTFTALTPSTTDAYGIYLSDYPDYGSDCTVARNTISNIAATGGDGYGIYCSGSTDGSRLWIYDNVATGVPGGTTYGLYCNYVADSGAFMEVHHNEFTGFTDSAVYFNDDTDTGGTLLFHDNTLTGGLYGIYYDPSYEIGSGGTAIFARNLIEDFTTQGFFMGGPVWGCDLVFDQNRFVGDSATDGVYFDDPVSAAAHVAFVGNCFQGVTTGILVDDIQDTSYLRAEDNDFSDTTTGINNVNGDAAHRIDAENNYWASAGVAGNVDRTPTLSAPPDSDADGVPNCGDACPDTPAGQTADGNGCSCLQLNPTGDADGDGVLDCLDQCPGTPDVDTDGDGVVDCLDGCPNDPAKTAAGACGCSVPDTDTDGDGTADCNDGCPNDPAKTAPGACGCGTPDTDTDGDGTPDCLDGCPNDPAKTAPGACGCGTPDVDSDGDGVLNCNDGCPNDPAKTAPGACGCGAPDTDTDGDGVADCIDNCPETANADQADADGDGVGDACEPRAGLCGAGACPGAAFSIVGLTILGLIRSRRR
ncbi:MAG: right-handed parallel beta-helix repeat-containing protein [Planctomycetota bacterium]